MNDDALLIARLEDKAAQAADRYMITSGDFLDSHQRRIAEETLRSRSMPVPVRFYGGFEDAERRLVYQCPYCSSWISVDSNLSAADAPKKITPFSFGRKHSRRTLISTFSLRGSIPWKFP